jgi:predicted metal-dependent peptidase
MTDKAPKDDKATMSEMSVRAGHWRECDTDFNLSRHLIPFLQDCAFYAEISRHIKKRFTLDIPTAAVTFDPRADELIMYTNPVFTGGGSYKDREGELVECEPLSNWEIRGLLTHEFNHPIFGHLSSRRRNPPGEWNVACDLANNSIIVSNAGQPRDTEPGQVARPLPKEGLIPGQRPYIDPKRFAKLSPRDQAATMRRVALIEQFPKMQASEWYFNKLQEDAKKNDDGQGDVVYAIGPMDDHDGWDDVPDDLREYVEGRIKGIVEKAVKHADMQSDGWGNISEEIRSEIRRSVSSIVNWRNVLRQFIGSLSRGHRSTSIKRINRRYPYVHPGIKRGYVAKLLIAIDESGSVSDEMLEMFFAELDNLTKKVSITLCHFDCDASESDLYEWRKGARPQLKRLKSGGTNFDAPTRIVNDPKNRGRWDGILIATDGQADIPIASRIKRGWILGQGCKLMFPTNELQINLSKERPMVGAWR